ncbi:MAG: hypothetical protein Q8L68_04280 [Methylococcales bacterium]|nr:hypothetical protein [Methylococcales bacterium]
MKKIIPSLLVFLQLTGCAVPSTQYLMGQGFYSDKWSKTQVTALANQGKVENMGKFEVSNGACFNTSQSATDKSVVIPAIQQQLKQRGADVADNVSANERWLMDFALGLLIIPGFIGCSNWNINGDALKVTP